MDLTKLSFSLSMVTKRVIEGYCPKCSHLQKAKVLQENFLTSPLENKVVEETVSHMTEKGRVITRQGSRAAGPITKFRQEGQ